MAGLYTCNSSLGCCVVVERCVGCAPFTSSRPAACNQYFLQGIDQPPLRAKFSTILNDDCYFWPLLKCTNLFKQSVFEIPGQDQSFKEENSALKLAPIDGTSSIVDTCIHSTVLSKADMMNIHQCNSWGYQNDRLPHQVKYVIFRTSSESEFASSKRHKQSAANCLSWMSLKHIFACHRNEVQCCHCGTGDCTLALAACPCAMESICTRDLCHQCGGNSFERCARTGYEIQLFNVDDINACHGLGTYIPSFPYLPISSQRPGKGMSHLPNQGVYQATSSYFLMLPDSS